MGARATFAAVALGLAVVALASACGDAAPPFHPALDTTPVKGARFDPNDLMDAATLTDEAAVDRGALDLFFARTPYGRASFLASYQSNGLRASEAIVAVARAYGINPIVLLTLAETEQALVALASYPTGAPSRVEYAFGCGCTEASVCRAEQTGFDRQLTCAAQDLRLALDRIQAEGATASGWGPDVTKATGDGASVTPANDATAALYDRVPFVRREAPGGVWILWNVYQIYATALGYAGPAPR